jgi:pimeloyl-ACP methyl ester carboxylesterase
MRLRVIVAVLVGISGCAVGRNGISAYVPPGPPRGVVYVADGAGGFDSASNAVIQAIADECLPLRVQRFEWTHGVGRVLADHFDRPHSECEARTLASEITRLSCCNPRPEVYIIAHSAGAGVALYTAEDLPPDSLNRIILLAPSVAAEYDLGPALRSTRCGIDVFYSRRDRIFLGFWTTVLGTTDRRWMTAAAGRVGFDACPTGCEQEMLLNRLHQHPWDPSMRAFDNRGGHYASYEQAFLHAYVLPLLNSQ